MLFQDDVIQVNLKQTGFKAIGKIKLEISSELSTYIIV